MIILNILVLFVEAFYFYMPLKEMKEINDIKGKVKLYIGIFLANIISVLVFGSSVFRYVLYFIIIYLVSKLINNNKSSICDFFIIPALMLIKSILEYTVFILFYDSISYALFVILLEIISIIFVFLPYKRYNKIYSKINDMWNGINKFYFRYSILISFNFLILFLLYNLIRIKEVL